MRKISLHTQIFFSIILGFIVSGLYIHLGWDPAFIQQYIKPFGSVFLNSLKAAAVPMIVTSLIVGISSVENNAKLSRIGGKTFLVYTLTTIFSVSLGLLIGNVVRPGRLFSAELRAKLMAERMLLTPVINSQETGWGDMLVNLVPENLFQALSSNESLLQIVIISIIFALALLKIPARRKKLVVMFCQGVNDAFIEIINLIMRFAPIGVFALIASLLTELSQGDTGKILDYLYGLGWYTGTVLLSLGCMTFLFYPTMVAVLTNVSWKRFVQAMRPAQLVAFSTSSSSASLPVTIERVEHYLGVPEDISSFVLPIGATVNMDGTALYQGIATLFMAQAFGIDLSIQQQFLVVFYVTASSIGVAGVPGASIATTTMLLGMLNIPLQGLTLVMIPDRILDMCRTVTNITGDAAVAVLVASSEGWLGGKDNPEDLDDPKP